MKTRILCLLLVLGSQIARAQSFDEWFNQKKTQQSYLLEQLAALRLYGGFLQEGYGLAREGLSAIGLAEEGERLLHAAYFDALAGVSPVVATRGSRAVALGAMLRQLCLDTGRQVQGNPLLTAPEKAYVGRVLHRLLREQEAVQGALAQVLSPAQLEMEDAGRLERLDTACQALQELCGVARRLSEQAQLLALARWQQQHALQGERQWFDVQGAGK